MGGDHRLDDRLTPALTRRESGDYRGRVDDRLPPLEFKRRHESDVEPEGLAGWVFGGGTAAGVAAIALAALWISLDRWRLLNVALLLSGLSMTLKGVMQIRLAPRPPDRLDERPHDPQ